MLIGRYASKVSVKGRVAVPVKLRDELGKSAIIAQGYEKSLLLVAKTQWQELTAFLSDKPLTLGTARDTERFLYGSAFEAEFDEQGRIVIPQELRAFAGLADEAVFLGLGNRVEIWSRDRWSEYEKKLAGHIEEIAERLGEHDEQQNSKFEIRNSKQTQSSKSK